MRNRFNLNESEKNRIKALHGIKVITENIGAQIQASLEDDTTKATRADYNEFMTCLEEYNIDDGDMSTANVFVNNQLDILGIDSTDPDYYSMRIGLIGTNLMKNEYDVYNRQSDEPSCALEISLKFLPDPS
tara:strand:- start:147 stop:539 length:393 start_codon:yes stop_codon:yes gene_type:complete